MLSGFLDLFSSSSDKKTTYEDHILPIPQHAKGSLSYTDCFLWLDQKVVILLRRFDNPQVGTVKYIGSDDKGELCAGIEFEYNIGGMSGKVHGQKLFKCRSGFGLLVPVEYVRLLVDHENGTNIFPPVLNPTPSAPLIDEYFPVVLPGLKVGDNAVWLGGATPQTGIVRWIGRAGTVTSTIKAWMEMDDYLGFGETEIDLGTKFNCTPGRGKFLPVDELILLENFVLGDPSQQIPSFQDATDGPLNNVPCPVPIVMENSVIAPRTQQVYPQIVDDLIDFSDSSKNKKESEENSLADQDFRRLVQGEEAEKEDSSPSSNVTDAFSSEYDATAPPPSLSESDLPPPITNNSNSDSDVNGNLSGSVNKPQTQNVTTKIPMTVKLVDENSEDYMPPFIIPPIDILEFFRAEGQKGIQGKRNSCYIDVVLFAMFAFTDTFDPYFLSKSTFFSKEPDSALTKTAKKVLAEQIVNPLRQNYYCSATGVTTIRELMMTFSDKLDGAFMDIEEVMLIMFDKLFQIQEFIVYDNNVKDYLHQVNLGDYKLPPVITLKQCLEMSMKDYKLKFKSLPSPAFIVEIPRNHSGIIQSTTIIPNLTLDLESLMSPENNDNRSPNVLMNLVAVICINDFHFVTFVKCGKGPLSHWVLFDSNPSEERPKVEVVTNMGECLESLEHQALTNPLMVGETKHKLPPLVQRLLSDIYVCIYCPSNMI